MKRPLVWTAESVIDSVFRQPIYLSMGDIMGVRGGKAEGPKGAAALDDGLRRRTHTRFVPTPMELCRPILTVLRKDAMDHQTLRKAVAHHLHFPFKAIKTKYPGDDGASFAGNFLLAIHHLQRNKSIAQSGKMLHAVLDATGRTGPVPPMRETKPHVSSVMTLKWPVNIDKLKAELPLMSLDRIVECLEGASQRFDMVKGKKKITEQINAIAVSSHVMEECVRRGYVTYDGESGDFRWPTTKAPGGGGSLMLKELPKIGPLNALGYRVGKGARGPAQRHRLLTKAFLEDLPMVEGVEEWGANNSSQRLQKMALSIAAFARNAKRRSSANWAKAIVQWENDLEYLRVSHYVGRFDGVWVFPSTAV